MRCHRQDECQKVYLLCSFKLSLIHDQCRVRQQDIQEQQQDSTGQQEQDSPAGGGGKVGLAGGRTNGITL